MSTTPPHLIRVETVADLPVLWAILQQLDLPATLDRHFPPTLRWAGELSPGEVLALWLMFVLSQADHRLNQVEPWIEQHQSTLSALLAKTVKPNHAHDDRLAALLDRLGDEKHFAALETDLNQQTLRVYQLPTEVVRIDATTANSHAQVFSEEGLLQFGHSKDDPDRPQLKIATAVLDPLGMPLATSVVPGNTADDPLYIPAIEQVRVSLGTGGRTYVGDCKMAALSTRAFLEAGGDFYLCPLSESQLSRAQRRELLQPVWQGKQALQSVYPPEDSEKSGEVVAEGFLVEVEQNAVVDGQAISWTERRWMVRSRAYAASGELALERRLETATRQLEDLPTRKRGKKVLDEEGLRQAAEDVLSRNQVQGLLSYQVHKHVTRRPTRAYKDRPAREEEVVDYTVDAPRHANAIEEKKRELGWQVYANNQSGLDLSQVVRAYRDQYRVEKGFSRVKGRPLGLTPMYLQDETRMQGLVQLLSVALRLLTLMEWRVREALSARGEELKEIDAGQKGRKTKRPSAELLLAAMKHIHISVVEVGEQYHVLLSPMSKLQRQLLELWGLAADLYDCLVQCIPKPPPIMSEP
jgi:transposase